MKNLSLKDRKALLSLLEGVAELANCPPRSCRACDRGRKAKQLLLKLKGKR